MVERVIPELAPLNAPLDKIETGDLRQLARSLGIPMSFNPEDQANIDRMLKIFGLSAGDAPRLVKALQAGIPHQVLNARKHDEE